jgi:catechol 2,3-dioxygenase-like lactoylglutathione lyase family enzyme
MLGGRATSEVSLMASIEFRAAVPVLPALDIEASVSFYQEKLGFTVAFRYPDYAGVQRGPVQIHFWRCKDPEIPKMTSCRINLLGVDAFYESVQKHGVVHPSGPLGDKPWGFREFTALDLCGNAIVFAEPRESAA